MGAFGPSGGFPLPPPAHGLPRVVAVGFISSVAPVHFAAAQLRVPSLSLLCTPCIPLPARLLVSVTARGSLPENGINFLFPLPAPTLACVASSRPPLVGPVFSTPYYSPPTVPLHLQMGGSHFSHGGLGGGGGGGHPVGCGGGSSCSSFLLAQRSFHRRCVHGSVAMTQPLGCLPRVPISASASVRSACRTLGRPQAC